MKLQRDFVLAGIGLAWVAACAAWVVRSNERMERQLQGLPLAVRAQLGPATDRERSPSIDADALGAEVRRALAELGPQASCDCKPPFAEQKTEATGREREPPSPPGPEAIAAFDGATRLVDDALARKSWTNGDREQLHDFLRRMDAQTRADLLGRLFRSINEGKLTPTGAVL